MPFLDEEYSAHSGRPIQLYEFLRSSGDTDFYWRYNGSDRDLTFGEEIFKAIPVSDTGARFNSEAANTDFTVTMPVSEEFCQNFRAGGSAPSDTIYLRVRRAHAEDITDIDTDPVVTDALVVWVGTVSGVKQTNEITADVICSMLSASLQRGGLRYGYQRSCPHLLYAPNTCKADREAFRVDATVTTVDGYTVNATEFGLYPDGDFSGGFIEYTSASGFLERKMVSTHTGTALALLSIPVGLEVGSAVVAFPGCNRTTDRCTSRFDNLANHGGFPALPGRNPFDGMPVF